MNFTEILLYSLLAGVAALLGTGLLFYFENWSRKNSAFLVSFATGVMLTIAFLNLIPEAAHLHAEIWPALFGGFLALYSLQNIVMFHPCHDDECTTHLGVLSAVGLSLHSLLDGIVIAVGFEAGWSLGILTTVAVILHKMPDGITITGILMHSGASKRRVLLLSTLVALATPAGAIFAFLFLKGISPRYLGILLALTAGSFIYLAASDLLPEAHRVRHRRNSLFFFSGVVLILLLEYLFH